MLGILFDFRQEFQSPFRSSASFPITLQDGPDFQVDFGRPCGKPCTRWITTGKTKEIPVSINAGSVSDRFLVLDLTFGAERRRTHATRVDAVNDFENDVPIWQNTTGAPVPRNFGVSIRSSTFARAIPCEAASDAFDPPKVCEPPVGLLAHILPLRIRGSKEVISGKLKVDYSIILDGAEAKLESKVGNPGEPGWVVKASSNYAAVRPVVKVNGVWTPGPSGSAKVETQIIFDKLRVEEGELQFRVADFSFKARVARNIVPSGVFSSGALEQSLNGGKLPLNVGVGAIPVGMPACLPLHGRFKSNDYDCASPGVRLGALSRDLSDEQQHGKLWQIEPLSWEVKPDSWLMLTGGLKEERLPNLPEEPLKKLLAGHPLFVTQWRATNLTSDGSSQCGHEGGTRYTAIGDWTSPIRMDTDDRWGGCKFRAGLIDPRGTMVDPEITIDWQPTEPAAAGQCTGKNGIRNVPLSKTIPVAENRIVLSESLTVDTDDGAGGCFQTFAVGSDKFELDVYFGPDDLDQNGVQQCGPDIATLPPVGHWTVSKGNPLTLTAHTDSRYGGCLQKLRLRAK